MLYRHIMSFVSLLCLVSAIGMTASPVRAEQVWDDELNRYLTPEELGHEEIYMSPEEAAKLMFPDSEQVEATTLVLTPEQKKTVEERIGWQFPEDSFECFIGRSNGKVDGWAMIQHTIGKHKPMTYMVGVDADGEVLNVEVLIYRESRGSEVRTDRFNYQYEGKTLYDPIRINRDIINISGATMSVRSMSAGVKRVLVLVDEIYLKPEGRGSNAPTARKREKGFFEVLFGL